MKEIIDDLKGEMRAMRTSASLIYLSAENATLRDRVTYLDQLLDEQAHDFQVETDKLKEEIDSLNQGWERDALQLKVCEFLLNRRREEMQQFIDATKRRSEQLYRVSNKAYQQALKMDDIPNSIIQFLYKCTNVLDALRMLVNA